LGTIRRIEELWSGVVIAGDRGSGGKGEVTERQEIGAYVSELYRVVPNFRGRHAAPLFSLLSGGYRYDDYKEPTDAARDQWASSVSLPFSENPGFRLTAQTGREANQFVVFSREKKHGTGHVHRGSGWRA
jgi:hypothetical protein